LFYYREQQQLFVYDLSFFCERYLTHGGLSLFVSQFIIQFFTMPYVGAIVTAAFGVLTAFFLYSADMGLLGAWIALFLDQSIRAACATLLVRRMQQDAGSHMEELAHVA
ncbi:MAG: hypothetical protein J6I74_05745, partial [Schwartzia sp.]|nr:hypothetical protein [Schwartzia sp. (in: firmicutes)]